MTAGRRAAAALLLVALAAALYAPVWGHPYTPLDDAEYVENNPVVLQGLTADGVRWAFTTFHAANWHPLAWLSHMADVSLLGPAPGPQHGVNSLLHGANGALLFLFLAAATGAPWRSLAAAALFAVHPLHVESVAWISERKDVLCATFLLLSLLAWLRYARGGGKGAYALAVLLHALALLAKPMAVTLPVLLLLLDRWPLARGPFADPPGAPFPSLLLEKLPFALLSGGSAVATLAAQSAGGAVTALEDFPLAERLGNAFLSYAAYLGQAFLPLPRALSLFHLHPSELPGGFPWAPAAAAALLFAAAWGAAVLLRHRFPWLLAGWAWFTATLVPVIGLVQAGLQGRADRYAYLPVIGIYWAACWGVAEAAEGLGRRRGEAAVRRGAAACAAAALLAVALLSGATRERLALWREPVRLFGAASAAAPNYRATGAVGMVLVRERRYAEAEGRFREALALRPTYIEGWGGLGLSLLQQGRNGEAEAALLQALRLGSAMGHDRKHLAVALQRQGRHAEAREWFLEAAGLDPIAADTRYNLAITLEALGREAEAEAAYREAVRLRPGFGKGWNNLGNLLLRNGRPREAVPPLEEAVRLDPDDPVARGNLERALATAGLR